MGCCGPLLPVECASNRAMGLVCPRISSKGVTVKRALLLATTAVCGLALAGCSSSSSSSASSSAPAPSGASSSTAASASAPPTASGAAAAGSVAAICPEIDKALTAAFAGTQGTPTQAQLKQAEASATEISATASAEAQAIIQPMIASLKTMQANPSAAAAGSPGYVAFAKAANEFQAACTAAGAPLATASASAAAASPSES